MTKKKKIVILSCMIALLAVTAVFNFVLTTGTITATETASTNLSYFAGYRTERLNSRNEEIVQLDSIIASAEVGSEEYNQALNMKIELTKNSENELLLENLIKAYGFEDAIVVIGLESENVNVIVKSESASEDEAIIIYTIIDEELNITPENVKIIPIS